MQTETSRALKQRKNGRIQNTAKAWIIRTLGVAVLAIFMAVAFTDETIVRSDFIAYWTAGHLLKNGQNPYDAAAVHALEARVGHDPGAPLLVMRNPPPCLLVALPLGCIGPKVGFISWTLFLIGVLVLVSWLLWVLHGRPDSLLRYLGFGFPPIVACLMVRQTGILLLLGITLFLFLWKDRPFLAGVSLWLCALKPHVFVPFGVALFLWCLMNKKGYRILAGFGVAFIGGFLLVYAMDPQAWSQYASYMQTGGELNEVVPTLSAYLRLLTNPHAVWIQFLPVALAFFWTIWYFWTRGRSWDWMNHGLVLLLVGAMCAPFGFPTDESMVLPAVLAGAYRCVESRRPTWPLVLLVGVGLFELMIPIQIVSRYYLWTTPAWLFWYLYATERFPRWPLSAESSPRPAGNGD